MNLSKSNMTSWLAPSPGDGFPAEAAAGRLAGAQLQGRKRGRPGVRDLHPEEQGDLGISENWGSSFGGPDIRDPIILDPIERGGVFPAFSGWLGGWVVTVASWMPL